MSDLRRLVRDAIPDGPDLDLRAVTARAAQLRVRRRAALAAAAVSLTAAFAALGSGLLASPEREAVLSPTAPTQQPAASPTPSSAGGRSVLVYFSPPSSSSCDEVVPVERPLTATTSAAPAAALEQLFRGPTPQEQARGLTSFFGAGTEGLLRSVRIEERTAYVDLNDITAINNASTSCGSAAFLAQLDATVEQFGTADQVLYAVEGDPARFYRSLERTCPPELVTGQGCDATPFQDEPSSGSSLPPQAPAVHGGSATAVYLAVAEDPEHPDLLRARARAREAGYREVGPGDIGCDQGAREALGLAADRSYYSVALYFEDAATADRFVQGYGEEVVGVVAVTTYCLD